MARLGRSQPGYRSGHSFLRPPAAVEAEAVFIAPPLRVQLADDTRNQIAADRRNSLSGLGAPAVIAPDEVIGGALISLAPPPPRRLRHSRLSPPAPFLSAPPVETTIRLSLADTIRSQAATRRRPLSGLGQPSIVTPDFGVVGGDLIQLAEARNARSDGRRAPSSRLSPPAVVTSPTPPFAPVRLVFAGRQIRIRYASHSRLFPPTVVDPEPQSPFPGLRIKLAPPSQGERRRQNLFWKLSPPAVVAPAPQPPIETTIRVRLTEPHRPAKVKSRLFPPAPGAVAAAPPVKTTLDITLAPSRDPRRRFAKSELRPPTILFFVAEPIRTNKAQGADLLVRRGSRTLLLSAISYPAVETVVRTTLTAHPARREYTHYLTQFFGILQVVAPVLGHFDEPTPAAGQFDRSGPSAAQFDEPTPTAGHFDEPTPS